MRKSWGIFALFLGLAFVANANAQITTKRNYKEVLEYIRKLAVQYPDTTRLISIGFSDAGVAIEGLQIGNGPVKNLLVATHHGNEYGSTEVALGFATDLAQAPIPGQTMYIIPVLNIDGYNRRDRYEKVNNKYIDQNRDYPGPCGTSGPFFSRSTKALADFVEKENIVVSSTIHTYWPAVVYPWGISTSDVETPYTNEFIELAKNATSVSRYKIGNNTLLLYPADGTFEDYAYWKHGVWSMLFEIGKSHSPNLPDLERMVQVTVPGLRLMYERAPTERAENHQFEGKCSVARRALDFRLE